VPLAFVAQIQLADIAPFDVEKCLPATGILHFFFGPTGWRVLYYDTDTELQRTGFPAALPLTERLPACHVYFRHDLSLPDGRSPGLSGKSLLRYAGLRARVGRARGTLRHCVLGHPDFENALTYNGDGDDWLILLQLDTDATTGLAWAEPARRLAFLIDRTALVDRRFDDTYCLLVED
jgi:uncharacterized protein YwqG